MSQMQQRVINVISKPSELRKTLDIDVILPWFRKKSPLMQSLDKSVIVEIVKRCEYKRVTRDDVIIVQGEKGDCFYIILSGVVSVYIDATKSGEDPTPPVSQTPRVSVKTKSPEKEAQPEEVASKSDLVAPSAEPAPSRSLSMRNSDLQSANEFRSPSPSKIAPEVSDVPRKSTRRSRSRHTTGGGRRAHDRAKYGKCVIHFESGRSFGEIALMTEDAVRNASIIADEDVDLMVIHRDLYNQTLKAFQEAEYADRRAFVNEHFLFRAWTPRFRRLLEMSLIKEVLSFDTPIIRQGEAVNGLSFIRKGRAKVLVEPNKHVHQYPEMKPFKTDNDVYEIENLRPKGLVPAHERTKKVAEKRSEMTRIRRQEGYVAAEKRIHQRHVVLCHVEEGEIIGDLEAVMGLGTNSQTLICTSYTEVYTLNSKNMERLITRKNPRTLDLLRESFIPKLLSRAPTVQGKLVPLLRHVLFKLTEELKPRSSKRVSVHASKDLPDQEILFQHMMNAYVDNKAPLIKPYVPGSVYYREMMREKARIRESVKQHAHFPRHTTRKQRLRSHKPRTLVALRMDLEKQLIVTKKMESQLLLKQLRERERREIEDELTSRYGNRHKIPSLKPAIPAIQASSAPGSVMENRPRSSSGRYESGALRSAHSETPTRMAREEVVLSGDEIIGTGDSVLELANKTSADPHAASQTSPVTSPTLANADANAPKLVTETDARGKFRSPAVEPPSIRSVHRSEPNHVVPAHVDEEQRLRFVNKFLREQIKVDYETPTYRDWETSDKTLSHLETRIQEFTSQFDKGHRRHGQLPRLARYEHGDEYDQQPVNGGKVLVQKQPCSLLGIQHSGNNHQHAHYRVVPHIPQDRLGKLRRDKMVEQLYLDKWAPPLDGEGSLGSHPGTVLVSGQSADLTSALFKTIATSLETPTS